MLFLLHIFLAIISLIAIIYTCSLFTNAIEHFGEKFKLGNNATGSILAVIGTGLPETIVPLVAVFGSIIFKTNLENNQDIALGAIIGSPFMLSTLTLFILGITLLIVYFMKKRDKLELILDEKNILRDYKYFLFAYVVAIIAMQYPTYKYYVVLFLIALYAFFVYQTIVKSKQNFIQNDIEELIFSKYFNLKSNSIILIIFQIAVSLLGLIIFSHFFVNEISYFAKILNLSPLILSLVVTPFATELPECVNSIIWVKNNKDDLAMANVIGAIVFQAMVPFSIGMVLTPWVLSKTILLNAAMLIICSIVFVLSILIYKKIKLIPLLFCGIFYFGYIAFLFFRGF